ncbi:MAG: phytanoyl-CoA dioxygenase family protein, partial [Ferruginibacter sp.]
MKNQIKDLSTLHQLVSDLFSWPKNTSDWDQYKLSAEQLEFFDEFGYLSNIKLLNEGQVDKLSKELAEITDPAHPAHELFYEFHSNESSDPNAVLFHALGAWRITN